MKRNSSKVSKASKILREANTRNSKRKRKFGITDEDKLKYVKRLENGESTSQIAKEVGVAPSTLREWKKECIALDKVTSTPSPRQKKVRAFVKKNADSVEPEKTPEKIESNSDSISTEKKPEKIESKSVSIPTKAEETNVSTKQEESSNFSTTSHPKLDEAIFRWFETNRQQGMFISCARLKSEAMQINEQLEGDDTKSKATFLATEQWLSCWKARYGIRYLPETLEKVTTDKFGEEEFRLEVIRVLGEDDLKKCQVFNCSETSWSWKNLPIKISTGPSRSGIPQRIYATDDYVTVMAFSNADFSLKLPLVIIKKPGNIQLLENKNNLPLFSIERDEAWMFSSVLQNFFRKDFAPAVSKFLTERNLPQKAVLIVDNARFMPTTLGFGDIKTVFIPKNSTCLMRPFYKELESLRNYCKTALIISLALHVNYDKGKSLERHFKESITLVNLLNWIHIAWEKEKRDEMWELLDSLRSIEVFQDFTEEDVNEWLRDSDDDFVTKQSSQTAVEIVQTPDMTAYVHEALNQTTEIISPSDAVKYLDSVIEFFCHCRNLSETELSSLRLARETANSMSI